MAVGSTLHSFVTRGRLRKWTPLLVASFLLNQFIRKWQATYESRCSATIEYGYRRGETGERQSQIHNRTERLRDGSLGGFRLQHLKSPNYPQNAISRFIVLNVKNSVHWSENAFFPREFFNPLAKHTQLHNSLHKQQNEIAESGHLLCYNCNAMQTLAHMLPFLIRKRAISKQIKSIHRYLWRRPADR